MAVGSVEFQEKGVLIPSTTTNKQWNIVYPSGLTSLPESQVATFTVNQFIPKSGTVPNDFRFHPSTTYDIKIIGVDNTQLSFQVKK